MKNLSQTKKRIGWIDYTKGIGIFLVVIGHVLRGLSDTVSTESLSTLETADQWIYAFHMPLFFFLSGLFASAKESKPAKVFFSNQLRSIAYPYIIWSGIVGILLSISREGREGLIGFAKEFWTIAYQPVDIFWFLYTFFAISTIYYLLRKLVVSKIVILLGALVLYVTCAHLFPTQVSLWSPLKNIGTYSIYFVLGACVSNKLLDQAEQSATTLLTGAIVGFSLLTTAVYFNISIPGQPNLVLALVGTLACLLSAKFLSQQKWMTFLKSWGALSLPIYVSHTAFAAVVRLFLYKAGIESLPIHIVVGTAAGIYLPIFLSWAVTHSRFPYLFSLPKSRKLQTNRG